MTIFEKILNIAGLTKANTPMAIHDSAVSSDAFNIWASSKKIPASRAFEVFTGWVYACIRAVAEEIQGMEFQLFETDADGEPKQIQNHELLDLLDAVNNYQTGMELKYATGTHLELCGNAYWHLEGVKNETDKPTAIHILNAAKVKIKVNRNVFPAMIEEYTYQTITNIYHFKPYEILHIKYPDPNDPFEGIGTVQTIAQWIDADNYAMEFNRRFFLHGARLGGVLESDSAQTPATLDYLKKSFESVFKGVENAYKVAALPKGTKFTAVSENQKDMDFSNLMTMMRDRILAGFRVPRTALGITDDVNRANAEATNYVFALRTIKPKMKLICSFLNEFLVPRYGDNLYLDFEDPVPENRDQEIVEMAAAMGSQPIMSANEARRIYFNLEPIDNGDEVMTDFSKIPLGAPAPKAQPQKRQTKNNRIATTRFARNVKIRKELTGAFATAAVKALKDIEATTKKIRKKDITTLSDEEFEVLWKGFVVRVTPYEKTITGNIQKFNADQEKEVQKNLKSSIKFTKKGIDENALFNKDEWIGALVDLTEPAFSDLMGKEGKAAAALLGFEDVNIMTPEVKKALRRSIELMADTYNETTLQLLKKRLDQGLSEGLSLAELGDRITEVYEFSDEQRAMQVARTETFRVANSATKEAWQKTGVVKTIKWFTAADERVCPYCEPLHGKVVSIDEDFFTKGDVVTGSDGTSIPIDYADVQAPPLHVSCRCYLRPQEISIA